VSEEEEPRGLFDRLASRWRLTLGGIAALLLLASPLWGPPVLRRLDFFRVRRVFLHILGDRPRALFLRTANPVLRIAKADGAALGFI